MDERHSRGRTFMDSDDWNIQQDNDGSVTTSKHRKKRFLGSHHSVEASSSHSSKSYTTHNTTGGEITRGNKENRSDALNRLLARRKRSKLSSLYYSSDEDDADVFPIASRRLSSSLLQDSSGSELDDSPGTEKSNESDVFGADDEFCMLSIEPKAEDQVKFNGRASGLLPGGGKVENMKPTEEHFVQEEFTPGFKIDKNGNTNCPKNGFSTMSTGLANWGNSDLNDSELPDLDPNQNLHMNGIVKKTSPDLTDGNAIPKSPNHALPGNFYKKKFSHMFTSGDKKKSATGRLSLLSSSSTSSDSESDSLFVNRAEKKGPGEISSRQKSPVFGSSNSNSPAESKKRKYSAESFFFSKKRRSEEANHDKSPRKISPILKKSSPFQFNDSPRFPPVKHNGMRRLSFDDEKTTKTAAAGHCSSDSSDSDAFWKISLPSKHRPKAQLTEKVNIMSQKSKQSTISASASRLSPPATSRSRIGNLKDPDPVRLSVSPKSRYNPPTSLVANQSLEEGMQFTDESIRKQLRDIFGNDSDEELDWQPTLKKTKMAEHDVGKKSKKTKGGRYFVKKASENTVEDYAGVKIPPQVHKKTTQQESKEMFSESDDDWEQKLQELVDDISSSSRRAKSGLSLLMHGGKKDKVTSAAHGQRASAQSSFTRTSPKESDTGTFTKPRNSSVSTFPEPNSPSRRYYDNRGLIRSESEELPKSVTLSSPAKLIRSVSSPKPKRRCRRTISNGSIIYIDDTDSGSSDDDVIPIPLNKNTMPLKGRVGRRDIGQVISPRIRELQEEDARNEYDAMLDPVLLQEFEEELTPAKPKKTQKSCRGRGSLSEPVEMVVEVSLDEAIQREIQAGLRFRSSGSRGKNNTVTSASRRIANTVGGPAATMRSTSGSTYRPVSHAASPTSPVSPGLFTFSAGQSHQSRAQNDPGSSPVRFYPSSPPIVKSPRGRGKKSPKAAKRNPATRPISANQGFSPDVIPFVPTSPALQSSARSRNRRSKQKTSRGSLNQPLDPDPFTIVQQIDDDEAMARRMQEQMDMEFAQALMREEESAVAAAHLSAQQSPSMPFPPPHMPEHFLDQPPIQMPVPRAFNPPSTSQFNPCHPPQASVRNSPTTRGRRRQTRSHIADQMAMNQIPNFDPHVDTAMFLHVAMGMGLVEQGRPATISPPTRRGRGRGRQRRAIAAANAVQGDDYEALLALGDIIGDARPKGLTKTSIEQLPTKIFKKTVSSGKDEECSVCMGEYDDGDNLRILPCFHNFHVKCIDKWIKDNATCPICRVPVKLS